MISQKSLYFAAFKKIYISGSRFDVDPEEISIFIEKHFLYTSYGGVLADPIFT